MHWVPDAAFCIHSVIIHCYFPPKQLSALCHTTKSELTHAIFQCLIKSIQFVILHFAGYLQ